MFSILKVYKNFKLSYSTENFDKLPKQFLVISNHQSLFDIPIFMTFFKDFDVRFVAKDYLVRQVSSSVRWQQSVERLIADGADEFVEIGPGRSLSGFMRKINRDVTTCNIDKMEDFVNYVNR